MEKLKLYENLARRFDQGMIGAPFSPTLIKILMLTFSEEEAEIALKLPFEKKTLPELKELFPEKDKSLELVLNKMAWRGSIFMGRNAKNEKRYHLWPSLLGWADTVFWADREPEKTKQLGQLWIDYRKEKYNEELARETPVFRVIPLETSITDESVVMPFDDVQELLKSNSYLALSNCACRQSTMSAGKGCDNLMETCFSLGSLARYLVNHDMAREINHEEALSVLAKANESGLVYMTQNINEKPGVICCCCSCCCIFMKAQKESGLATFASANYRIETKPQKCSECNYCIDRCLLDLITHPLGKTVITDTEKCVGCGNCVSVCQEEARVLVEKEQGFSPPTGIELFMSRLKPGPDYAL